MELCQREPNTIIDTLNNEKQEYNNRIGMLSNVNRKNTLNNTERIIIQEENINVNRNIWENDVFKENHKDIAGEAEMNS